MCVHCLLWMYYVVSVAIARWFFFFSLCIATHNSNCRCFFRFFGERERDEFSLLLVFASYSNDLAFNVCLKCRNEYKVYNIVCNLMVRCEYVVEVVAVVVVVAFDVVTNFFLCSIWSTFFSSNNLLSFPVICSQRVKRKRLYYVWKWLQIWSKAS